MIIKNFFKYGFIIYTKKFGTGSTLLAVTKQRN